jgi:hypothetical protein
LQLQWAEVVKQLGHFADTRQHIAGTHHTALAIAADGVS